MVEPHVEEVALRAAQQFTHRYWRHGDDPEAQYHLAVLNMAVADLQEQVESLPDVEETLDRAEMAEQYAEQLQNALNQAHAKLGELRDLADFWMENKAWKPGDAGEGQRTMWWGSAAGHILDIVGRDDG
jgi:ABC-type Fe3+-hydroxamate transport system substrate-binding protein